MYAATICSGKQTNSFMLTFMNSPGRSLVHFGEYNTKMLFCKIFWSFLQTTITKNFDNFINYF